MPNIDSLTAQADRLEKSFNHWNHTYLALVAITAFFVFLTFVAQWIASKRSGELDTARKLVIGAKDEQLKDEFAHRDERIAKVKSEASIEIAHVKADAQKESTRIEEEGKKEIAAANERASEANREAGKANAEAARLSTDLVAAQRQLEAEKVARAEIEKSVASRVLPFRNVNGKSNIDVLKPLAGTHVLIQTIPDWESRRASLYIARALNGAGWVIDSIETLERDDFEDGVLIQYVSPSTNGLTTEQITTAIGEMRQWQAVAERLANFLNDENWEANAHPVRDDDLKPGIIRVRVGLKPSPYELDPTLQQFKKKGIEMKREMRKVQEEDRKRVEELFRRLPPSEKKD